MSGNQRTDWHGRWGNCHSGAPCVALSAPSPRLPSGRLRPSEPVIGPAEGGTRWTVYGEGRGEGASPQRADSLMMTAPCREAPTRGEAPPPRDFSVRGAGRAPPPHAGGGAATGRAPPRGTSGRRARA